MRRRRHAGKASPLKLRALSPARMVPARPADRRRSSARARAAEPRTPLRTRSVRPRRVCRRARSWQQAQRQPDAVQIRPHRLPLPAAARGRPTAAAAARGCSRTTIRWARCRPGRTWISSRLPPRSDDPSARRDRNDVSAPRNRAVRDRPARRSIVQVAGTAIPRCRVPPESARRPAVCRREDEGHAAAVARSGSEVRTSG